jgi:hypothetical protein
MFSKKLLCLVVVILLVFSAASVFAAKSTDSKYSSKNRMGANDYKAVKTSKVVRSFSKSKSSVNSRVKNIRKINHAPVLNKIKSQNVDAGDKLTFTVKASDVDNDKLRYKANYLPKGAEFNKKTNTFTWTPTDRQVGKYKVRFTVSDGKYLDKEVVRIIVGKRQSAPAAPAPAEAFGCAAVLTESLTLTEDVSCPANAFTIGADDVVLDCNGFSVTYTTAGGNDEVYGISNEGYDNFELRNCNLVESSASTGNWNYAVYVKDASSPVLADNTITTVGMGSEGVYMYNAPGALLNSNVVNAQNRGAVKIEYSADVTVTNNDLTAGRAGQIALWIENWGIVSSNLLVSGNTIVGEGSSGMSLGYITGAVISDNTVEARNDQFNFGQIGIGVHGIGADFTISGNTIVAEGNHGIQLAGQYSGYQLVNNDITVPAGYQEVRDVTY